MNTFTKLLKMPRHLLLAVFCLVVTPGAFALTIEGALSRGAACQAGGGYLEVYDDGVADSAYAANPDQVEQVEFVQRFNADGLRAAYDSVCLGLTTRLGETSLLFEIVAYDGTAHAPGAEIAAITALARDIPEYPDFAWYEFDLSSLPIINEAPVFIGARWAPNDPPQLLAADESPKTLRNPGFFNAHLGAGWQFIEDLGAFGNYRALMVRAQRRLEADLGVEQTVRVAPPARAIFDLTVTHHGRDAAGDAFVLAQLPACASYQLDNCGGQATGGQWQWSIGEMATDESASCTVTADITDCVGAGPQQTTAAVTSELPDPVPDNDSSVATFELSSPFEDDVFSDRFEHDDE